MKETKRVYTDITSTLCIIILALIVVMSITACKSGSAPGLTPTYSVVSESIVTNAQVVTSITVTNSQGVTSIQSVTNNTPITLTAYLTNVVYTVSPSVSNTVAALQNINTSTASLDPFSAVISGILALFGAGMTYYAKVKTNQAMTNQSVASTVITAIEGLAPAIGPTVKAAVSAQAQKQGTATVVNNTVQALTAKMP